MTDYKFLYETKQAYYFSTGKVVGDWWKFQQIIGLCKQCGQEFASGERHGPIDLEDSYPTGIGPGVCTECGHREDQTLQFCTHNIELTNVCKNCIENHHHIDWFEFKYRIYHELILQYRMV